MSGMGIKVARQSIEDTNDKVKEHLRSKKKVLEVSARLGEKINQLTDELKEQGVNIEEAVNEYIQAQRVGDVPPEIQDTFVDFPKTKKLVDLREQRGRINWEIDRIAKKLDTQVKAANTLMNRYPALRGGRKTRKKRKSRRRKRRKRKSKKKKRRKKRKTKRRKRN